MIQTILLVIIVLGLLVFVHELGHFLSARRNGISVEEFGFGFPPRLFGIKRGGTIYSINLFPLGGFVRLAGETTDSKAPGTFGGASFASKTKVLLAGVGMNLLTAYILLLGLCLLGLPPVLDHQFSLGKPTYAQPKQLIAADVVNGSPAASAGLRQGDYILAGNGQRFSEEQQLVDFTKAHAGQQVTLLVRRGGDDRLVQAQLKSDPGQTGYLGVQPVQYYRLRYSWSAPIVALGIEVQVIWATLAGLAHFVGSVPGLASGLFAKGVVSTDAAGPVGIVYFLSHLRNFGLAPLILVVMDISVALAVFNVLPLPALDGGRWALLLYQRISGHRLNQETERRIHTYGFALLLLIAVLVTVNDVKRF